MTKTITTKIDDVTYEKLVNSCNESNENKCQYLNRIVKESLDSKNMSDSVVEPIGYDRSNELIKITKSGDGTWIGTNGVTITEITE
jgi:hypothetical protein